MIKNWETTLSGLPAFIAACVAVYNALRHGEQPSKEEWQIIGASISAVLIAINAKDKNVTGGTIPQTAEAVARVESPAPMPVSRPKQ